MTDLVEKFHIKNCLNYVVRIAAPEHKLISLKNKKIKNKNILPVISA